MAMKRLHIVALLAFLVMICQLHPFHARKLGAFRRYKSSLVLHFQPGVNTESGDHSGVEDGQYMDSYEREVLVKDNGDQGWIDAEEEGGEEEEEEERSHESHPADELLQTQGADGTESYILGGY